MKKTLILISVLAALALLFSCASQPAAEEASQPAVQSIAPQTPVEEALVTAYERYASGLILEGATTYTVRSGDTLARIGSSLYHNGLFYPIIMMASRDVVLDPDRITPGMVLTVPDLERNLASIGAREAIRSFLREIAVIEEQRNRGDTARGIRDLADSL